MNYVQANHKIPLISVPRFSQGGNKHPLQTGFFQESELYQHRCQRNGTKLNYSFQTEHTVLLLHRLVFSAMCLHHRSQAAGPMCAIQIILYCLSCNLSVVCLLLLWLKWLFKVYGGFFFSSDTYNPAFCILSFQTEENIPLKMEGFVRSSHSSIGVSLLINLTVHVASPSLIWM